MTFKNELAPVLVTGGTGRTGARLVRRLWNRHVGVRIGSRRAPIPFDWHDSTTWPAAVEGVRAAYLCYSPDLAFPGASGLIADFAETAAEAGVQRLVLLSGRGEDGARAAEDSVQMCGLEWTVLRCSWFAQNFSEHFLLGPGRHFGRLLELTGPRLLTLQDVAAELSAAPGRRIEFVACTAQEFAADLANDGIPAEEALPLAGLFTEILDGRNSSSTSDPARALNRKPTDFATYASRTATTGVWATPTRAELR